MLHAGNENVRKLILEGEFGIEEEGLRIHGDGHLAHTENPFEGQRYIVKDFCENQVEINTPVVSGAKEAVATLSRILRKVTDELSTLPREEFLWAFSNPPYIVSEQDIPIAQYRGEEQQKTRYREYLAERYGKYKMTFSGIHVNFSFADELLKADFAASGKTDFRQYKDELYLMLGQKAAVYGWLLVALTAASPILDSSYVEKGVCGTSVFSGMASVRCSELGYWNYFSPVLDYRDVDSYAESIQRYVTDGLIASPSELYYPIRLKPKGENTLVNLRKNGINHIELRMFDLNPLAESGIDDRDLFFAQLFLIWLASTPELSVDKSAQVQAVQNFKHAAHFDLKTVPIVAPDGRTYMVADAAQKVLREMKSFYEGYPQKVQETLAFEEEKFIDAGNRYAWIIRDAYSEDFVKQGVILAKNRLKK